MNINKENIDKLESLYAEMETLNKRASDAILKAKDTGRGNKIKTTRDDQELEIAEEDLWNEVYWGGQTNAGELLNAKYPEVFELSKQAKAKAEEINLLAIKEFGFNPEKLTLISLIKLIQGIVNLNK